MDPKEVAASLIQPSPEPTPEAEPEETEEAEQVTAEADDTDTADEEQADEDQVEDGEDDAEEEPDEADPEEEATETYTLKIEGEEVEVTLDELVQSYQIDGAAQKRLQAATEAKKRATEEGRIEGMREAKAHIDAEKKEIEAARQELSELASLVGNSMFAPRVERPDPSMQQTDPVGFLQDMEKWRADQERIAAEQAKVARMTENQRAAQAKRREEVLIEERQALVQKRSDLRDKSAQEAFTANVRRAQEFAGFTVEEVNNFPDHRGLIALDKLGALLAQFDGQGETPAQRIVKKSKTPMKPGAVSYKRTQKQKQRRADRDRAKQTGDYKDVAKLLIGDAPPKR